MPQELAPGTAEAVDGATVRNVELCALAVELGLRDIDAVRYTSVDTPGSARYPGLNFLMKVLRFSMLLVLVAALALLAPLALASPPDPNWIRGIYDDGDLDNVISIITLSDALLEPSPLDACSFPIVIALLHQTYECCVPSEALPVIHTRAPPAF